eukprot:scaffold25363_cov54-Phaeocystis_antarctica.AAC.5
MTGAISALRFIHAEAWEALGMSSPSRASVAAAAALPAMQMRKVSMRLAASRLRVTAAGGVSASEAAVATK